MEHETLQAIGTWIIYVGIAVIVIVLVVSGFRNRKKGRKW